MNLPQLKRRSKHKAGRNAFLSLLVNYFLLVKEYEKYIELFKYYRWPFRIDPNLKN